MATTPVERAATLPAQPGELDAELARLREMVEQSRVDEARLFVKELVTRWPEDGRVQHWATVLAPPVARVAGPASGRDLARENAWIRAHAHEYPGCWLAIYQDQLIAADPDPGVVIAEAQQVIGPGAAVLWFQPKAWDPR